MKKLYEESFVQKIADKIREITGTAFTYKISEIPDGIADVYQKGKLDGSESASSGGTAVAEDISSGKIAFVKGKKVTGNVSTYESNQSLSTDFDTLDVSGINLLATYAFKVNTLFRKGSKKSVKIPLSNFGDALEDDVTEGKTFTSSSGLKRTGTKKASSGGSSGTIQKKSGTVTIESSCTSFVIETGLTRVDAVIVRKSSSETVANTFFWAHDGEVYVAGCGYRSQYVTGFSSTDKITVSGGNITCNQQGVDYPITSGKFNWVAYGE